MAAGSRILEPYTQQMQNKPNNVSETNKSLSEWQKEK